VGKGNRGNKEAKKPKQGAGVVTAPTTGTAAPPAPGGVKSGSKKASRPASAR
jgi:hypothetical protein